VKVQFESVKDKIDVLREKQHLSNSAEFSRVFIRSSKSHSERVMEQNFKTLLELLPFGKDYFITGNGKMIRRNENMQQARDQPNGAFRQPGNNNYPAPHNQWNGRG
jgi:hypothetical protein